MVARKIVPLLFVLCSFAVFASPATVIVSESQAVIASGDITLALDVERYTRTEKGETIVRARPTSGEGWAVLTSSHGQWYGNLRIGDVSYELRHTGNGAHALTEITERAPEELAPMPILRRPATREPHSESLVADAEPVVVDVLIYYTSRLRSLVDVAEIQNIANAAVEEANLAYERSGISHRIRLVGLEETNYDESQSTAPENPWEAARLRMVNPADGFMDEMHTRRDALHADAVVLLIGRSDACGYTTLMTAPASKDFAPNAFALSAIQCASRELTLAHELGHLMGLEHDRPGRVLGFEPAFPYAFGYRHPGDQFRTIMSTEIACQQRCPRVPYFSNPAKTHEGQPLGIHESDPQSANNALALEQTMPIVASFREEALPAMLLRSFSANRTEIQRGESITLTWDTENATTVELSGAGVVAAKGSLTVTPLQSTTYTLTISQPDVASVTASVRVVVNCGEEPCAISRRRSARHF